MPVEFDTRQVPASRGAPYVLVIASAIDIARPAGESWVVTLREPMAGLLEMDFRRGTEPPRPLTFGVDGDDARHSALFRAVSQFLREGWPNARRPS